MRPGRGRVFGIPDWIIQNSIGDVDPIYPFDEEHDWIFVRFPREERLIFEVGNQTRVQEILNLMTHPDRWDLYFNDVLLMPSYTLQFYSIQCGHTLVAIPKVPKLPVPPQQTLTIPPLISNQPPPGRLQRQLLDDEPTRMYDRYLRHYSDIEHGPFVRFPQGIANRGTHVLTHPAVMIQKPPI